MRLQEQIITGIQVFDVLDKHGSGRVNLPPLKEYLVNDRYLPTGETRSDTEGFFETDDHFYNATFEIVEESPVYELMLTKNILEIKASDSFNFLQLYTPPGMGVLAIEAMTCCINGFNNKIGLMELSPEDTFYATIQIQRLRK